MKVLLGAVIVVVSLSSACGPDEPGPPPPADVCPTPLVVQDDAVPVEQETTDNTAPDASCGEGGVGLFTFTAQSSGSYRLVGRDSEAIPSVAGIWTTHDDACGVAEQCAPASSTLIRDLDAGETIFIGARVDDVVVSMTVVPVAVVIDGAACDEISRFCAAGSECIAEICVGDEPVFLCADFERMEGETSAVIPLGNISVPTSDCGVSSVAATGAVRWVAPRAGVMSVRADNDASRISVHRGGCDVRESFCGLFGVFGGVEVDAGDVIFIAIESTSARQVGVTIDMLNPVEVGDECNPSVEQCLDSECVFRTDDDVDVEDGPRCTLVEARGTCAAPMPVALGEARTVASDTSETVRSPCEEDAEPGAAVFSFTAPHDLVLLPDDGAIVTNAPCRGVVRSSLCSVTPVSMAAGETVFLQHRYTRHGSLSSLVYGSFPIIRFEPHVVTALAVGDACDLSDIEAGWCAFDTRCVEGVCREG